MKECWRPGTMIYPLPAVLVSCGESVDNCNLFTASWTGTICSDPAMCYISVRPIRHSYEIIKRTREFTINLTTTELAKATDWCGVKSGRDVNKFREMNLTPVAGIKVAAPYVEESPLSIECKVKDIVPLGSHDMFIAEVVNVIADSKYIDPTTGAFRLDESNPLVYCHGHYFGLGEKIGKFGWSVQKKSIKKKKSNK